MSAIRPSADPDEIGAALKLLIDPGSVVELRAIRHDGSIASGYFSGPAPLVKSAVRLSDGGAAAIYLTLNPVAPALLSRAKNRVRGKLGKKDAATADKDVARRARLLIDLDAIRPSGISSTDEEHAQALDLARAVRERLHAEGWPEPALFDSGNGAHLVYAIDLPNDDEAEVLVTRVLSALASRHDGPTVRVDRTVFNGARITKLPGTAVRKGDDTTERPHRLARVLEAPEKLAPARRELLERLASEVSAPASSPKAKTPATPAAPSEGRDAFEAWLRVHGVAVLEPKTTAEGVIVWPLQTCPFNEDHRGGSSCVGLLSSGARFFKCQHDGCAAKKWADFKAKVGDTDTATRSGDRTAPRRTKRDPTLVCLADVEPQEVSFLWRPYLPLGKLALLEGDPSAGKTFVALAVAAAISRGYTLTAADGQEHEPREAAPVLYLTCEDGLADTLRPRLDSLGADAKHVHALAGWHRDEHGTRHEGAVALGDLDVLEAALVEIKPALVVVDPIQGFLGAEVDSHRANQTRPILAGLGRLAEKHGCAVLLIRHLSKATASRVLYRGSGSIDFTAAARSVLLAGEDPKTKARALVHIKSSCEAAGPSIGYSLKAGEGFQWTGVSELTAADLNAPEEGPRETSALEEAKEWLEAELEDGPRPSDEVQTRGKRAGIAPKTLRNAREELGVKAFKRHETGRRGAGVWLWTLPDQPAPHPTEPLREDQGQVEPLPEGAYPPGVAADVLPAPLGKLNGQGQHKAPESVAASLLLAPAWPLGNDVWPEGRE